MELIAASIAFGLTLSFAMLVAVLSPGTFASAKRKPRITEYRGPYYNRHGREVIRTGRLVL